jgi:hypothetical protein
MGSQRRSAISTAVLAAVAMLAAGCGEMTIRTWVTIIEDESGGYVEVSVGGGAPIEFDMLRLQGGFLTEVKLNTAELPGPMNGTLELVDVRIAGEVAGLVGKLCTWNDPTGASTGTLVIDLFGGNNETELFLDAKASTSISDLLGMPPVDFEEYIEMDLGSGLGIEQFLDAFTAGTPAGLFETESTIASTIAMGAITTVFAMETVVTNGAEPPSFDVDLLDYCGAHFATQGYGDALFYSINAKSGYLRHNGTDIPLDPLVIPLADIGAQPGDTLNLATVGGYHLLFSLKDGFETRLGGVFSSTDEVLPPSELFRIPGAIDVPLNVYTWPSIFCLFGECTDLGGDDIGEDFPINPSLNIVVPAGAQYLIVAPIDGWRVWGDNTGMGFGMTVAVSP